MASACSSQMLKPHIMLILLSFPPITFEHHRIAIVLLSERIQLFGRFLLRSIKQAKVVCLGSAIDGTMSVCLPIFYRLKLMLRK